MKVCVMQPNTSGEIIFKPSEIVSSLVEGILGKRDDTEKVKVIVFQDRFLVQGFSKEGLCFGQLPLLKKGISFRERIAGWFRRRVYHTRVCQPEKMEKKNQHLVHDLIESLTKRPWDFNHT